MLFSLLALAPLALAFSDRGAHELSRSRARAHYGRRAAPAAAAEPPALAKRDSYNGRATFYDVGLGACGGYNVASDYIVALNSDQYGSGYPGPECFKSITISYGGKTAVATIADECPTCPYAGLDMSRGLFDYFASESVGEFYMTWWYNDGSGNAATTTTSKYVAPTSTYVAPTTTYTPPTSTYTPPTSTYTPPTSTYVAPTSTYTPPAATTESATSSDAAAATTTAPASASSAAASVIPTTSMIPDVIVSNTTANATAASATSSAAGNNGTSPLPTTGNNLVLLNDLVAQYGRLVVVSAEK